MGAQQVAERAQQGGRISVLADEAMDRYAGGEDGAFEVVYDALAPELFAYLRKCNHAHAEDLVQQTFFQIHRARGAFIRGAPVKPWAFAIARRLLIDRQRRDRFETAARVELERGHRPVELPDEVYDARETAASLAATYQRIPATQRQALELVRSGMSTREAAGLLGTTVAAVKLRAGRALRALRRIVAGEERS